MALNSYALPFGLRQVKLTPIDNSGNLMVNEAVFLPASRTFSFSETESFEELQGDDRVVASHGAGPVAEWELEGGGISLDIWRILAGGTISTTGTSPNQVRKFTKRTSDSRPYFQVEGRAISDNGGDFVGEVFRCKADGDLEAEMANGSFLLTAASGKGYGNEQTEELYTFTHRETSTPLSIGGGGTLLNVTIEGTPTVTELGTTNLTLRAAYTNNTTAIVTDTATWVSASEAIATVDSAGVVTGVAEGTTVITASLGGLSDSITITVVP